MAGILGLIGMYRSFVKDRTLLMRSPLTSNNNHLKYLFLIFIRIYKNTYWPTPALHTSPYLKSVVVFCISLIIFFAPSSQANIDISQPINLERQPLSKSLTEVGKQFKLSILYPTELLKDIESPAVKGHLSPQEILQRLLAKTQLTTKIISDRVIAIVPIKNTNARKLDASPTYFEEIIVLDKPTIGSRIGTPGVNNSAPVEIISAPELASSGAQTLVEFLKFTPAVAGNSISTTVSNGGNGTADVTLRGLPATNTLVLINGRRVAPDGVIGNSVDINTIAPGVVERVEILTDGASALYGSDAIAGVVNVVLRETYDGVKLEQYFGQSSRGDLNTSTTNIIAGKDFDRGNVFFAASLYEQDALFSRDRSFSRDADARSRGGVDLRSSSTPNARVTLPSGEVLTLDQDNSGNFLPGTQANHFRQATDEDLFNFNEFTSSTSPLTRKNLHAAASYDLSNSSTLSANASFTQTDSVITLAPLPLFSSFENPPVYVSQDNEFNPFNTDILDIRRRFIELGNRTQNDKSEIHRYFISLKSSNKFIDWQVEGFWSRTDSLQIRRGLADANRVLQAIGPASECTGDCVPLNLFGPAGSIDQEQIDFIATTETVEGTSDLRGISGLITGESISLPAGTSEFAFGVEWRFEGARLSPSTINNATEFVGGAETQGANGERRILESYFEWHLPILYNTVLLESLDIELASRFSRYSDFGNNTSPKLGIKARPNQNLLLRATLGRGFRAPTLRELLQVGQQSQTFLTDPCSIPENVGVLPGCTQLSDASRFQFETVFTGNRNLQPEKSDNLTVGLVWTPTNIPGLRFSADWFHIDQKDIIEADPQTLIDTNATTTEFSDLVIRDDLGNISQILAPRANLGTRLVTGFDFSWDYTFKSQKLGAISFGGNAVKLQKFRQKQNSNSETEDLAGLFSDSASEGEGPLPEWKASLGAEWTKGQWQANYSINYIDSLIETIPRSEDTRQIDSWITHNAQLTYQVKQHENLVITLGVENLFDTEPPFVASALTDNFDGFAYNPKQRFFYGRLTYNF